MNMLDSDSVILANKLFEKARENNTRYEKTILKKEIDLDPKKFKNIKDMRQPIKTLHSFNVDRVTDIELISYFPVIDISNTTEYSLPNRISLKFQTIYTIENTNKAFVEACFEMVSEGEPVYDNMEEIRHLEKELKTYLDNPNKLLYINGYIDHALKSGLTHEDLNLFDDINMKSIVSAGTHKGFYIEIQKNIDYGSLIARSYDVKNKFKELLPPLQTQCELIDYLLS